MNEDEIGDDQMCHHCGALNWYFLDRCHECQEPLERKEDE